MLIPDTFLTVHEELLLFLWAVLLGCALEIIFDLFRAVRLLIPHKAAAVALEDIAFMLIWAMSIASFTSVFAKGDLRIFYIIGSVLGFILWRVALGNPLVRLLARILGAIMKLLGWIFSPLRAVLVRVRRKCTQKFVRNAKNQEKRKNIWSALLIAPQKMLYNICNSKGKQGEKKRGSEKKGKKE